MTDRPFMLPASAFGELQEAARAIRFWDAPPAAPSQGRANPTDLEEARRSELLGPIDRQLDELTRLIASQEALANAEILATLTRQSAQLSALRDQVQHAPSLVALAQLRGAVSETVQSAHHATRGAEVSIAGGIGNVGRVAELQASYARISAENLSWLSRTADAFDRRTQASTALAAKYGIDVSEETKKIEEARRREKEERDPEKKLDWRIIGLQGQIELHDKNLDNPNLTDTERQREEEARLKAEQELREAEARRDRLREAKKQADAAKAGGDSKSPDPEAERYAAERTKAREEATRAAYAPYLLDAASIKRQAKDVDKQGDWSSKASAAIKSENEIEVTKFRQPALTDSELTNGIRSASNQLSWDDDHTPTKAATGEPTAPNQTEPVKSKIALAEGPEAHNNVETPKVPKDQTNLPTQSRA